MTGLIRDSDNKQGSNPLNKIYAYTLYDTFIVYDD